MIWYTMGIIKLPQSAGTHLKANIGTFDAYGLPILSNLKVPIKYFKRINK